MWNFLCKVAGFVLFFGLGSFVVTDYPYLASLLYILCIVYSYYFIFGKKVVDSAVDYLFANQQPGVTNYDLALSQYKFNGTVSPISVPSKKMSVKVPGSSVTVPKNGSQLKINMTKSPKSKKHKDGNSMEMPSPIAVCSNYKNKSKEKNKSPDKILKDLVNTSCKNSYVTVPKNGIQMQNPLCPSKWFNTNLDERTYMSVNSPGFTSRIVERASETSTFQTTFLANRNEIATNRRKRNYIQEEYEKNEIHKKTRKNETAPIPNNIQNKRTHDDSHEEDENARKKKCDIDRSVARMLSYTSSISVLAPHITSNMNHSKKRKADKLGPSVNGLPESNEKHRKISPPSTTFDNGSEFTEQVILEKTPSPRLEKEPVILEKPRYDTANGTDVTVKQVLKTIPIDENCIKISRGRILNRMDCGYIRKNDSITENTPYQIAQHDAEYVSNHFGDEKLMLKNELLNDMILNKTNEDGLSETQRSLQFLKELDNVTVEQPTKITGILHATQDKNKTKDKNRHVTFCFPINSSGPTTITTRSDHTGVSTDVPSDVFSNSTFENTNSLDVSDSPKSGRSPSNLDTASVSNSTNPTSVVSNPSPNPLLNTSLANSALSVPSTVPVPEISFTSPTLPNINVVKPIVNFQSNKPESPSISTAGSVQTQSSLPSVFSTSSTPLTSPPSFTFGSTSTSNIAGTQQTNSGLVPAYANSNLVDTAANASSSNTFTDNKPLSSSSGGFQFGTSTDNKPLSSSGGEFQFGSYKQDSSTAPKPALPTTNASSEPVSVPGLNVNQNQFGSIECGQLKTMASSSTNQSPGNAAPVFGIGNQPQAIPTFGTTSQSQPSLTFANQSQSTPTFGTSGQSQANFTFGASSQSQPISSFGNSGPSQVSETFGSANSQSKSVSTAGTTNQSQESFVFPTNATNPAQSTSFGTPNQSNVNLTFGTPNQSQSTPVFGATGQASTNLTFGATNQPQSTPTFGTTSQGPTTLTFGATKPSQPTPAFGSTNQLQAAPAYSTTTTTQGAINFGTSQSQAKSFGESQPQANTFGANQSQSNTFGAGQPQSNTFGAGQPQSNTFGATGPAQTFGTTSSTFGSNFTQNPPTFGSGSSVFNSSLNQAVDSSQQKTPSFGTQSAAFGSSAPSQVFTFGQSGAPQFSANSQQTNTAAVNQTPTVQPFTFGSGQNNSLFGTNAQQPNMFATNSIASQQPQPTPAFNFGSTTPQPAFGAQQNFGVPAASNQTQSNIFAFGAAAQQPPAFNFGQSQNAQSFGSAVPTQPFSFNAPAAVPAVGFSIGSGGNSSARRINRSRRTR